MPTFLSIDAFQSILEAPEAVRRAGLAKRLYADFEAGALDEPERRAAISIFRALVRDDDVAVRHDFARFVAPFPKLPADIATAIANDRAWRVAAPFLRLGVALDENLLVDVVGQGGDWRQMAVARRRHVSVPVCAAMAAVGGAKGIAVLLKNRGAELTPDALGRIAERFGEDDGIADLLLDRPGIPGGFVEARIHKISFRLKAYVDQTGWMGADFAAAAMTNAVEHGLVEFAVGRGRRELEPIFARWSAEGRVTRGFVLRAACYGAIAVLVLALSKLARLPQARAVALMADARGYGRQSLIARAGFDAAEEDFIAAAIARFSRIPGGKTSNVWRAAIAAGIEDGLADPAASEAFLTLLEGFAADTGLVMPKAGEAQFSQAA